MPASAGGFRKERPRRPWIVRKEASETKRAIRGAGRIAGASPAVGPVCVLTGESALIDFGSWLTMLGGFHYNIRDGDDRSKRKPINLADFLEDGPWRTGC